MPDLRLVLSFLILVPLTGACQTPDRGSGGGTRAGGSVSIETSEAWRSEAMAEHAGITEDLPPLFGRLAGASRGRGARTAADRTLLDPDLRLPRAAPAPGGYRCRMVRLGAPAPRTSARNARQAFCFVGAEGDRLSLTMETTARRLGGYLWDSSDGRRLVFLGAEIAPRARTAPPYGEGGSSTAGIFERIGDFRYRLVVRGREPGAVDVYELIAAPPPG